MFEEQQISKKNVEEKLRMKELENVANAERFRSSVAQIQEDMQILECEKDEQINSLRLGAERLQQSGEGRPSHDGYLSQFPGVFNSTAIGRSSLVPPEGLQTTQREPVSVKRSYIHNIHSPAEQRYTIEKDFEESIDELGGDQDQAFHAMPKVPKQEEVAATVGDDAHGRSICHECGTTQRPLRHCTSCGRQTCNEHFTTHDGEMCFFCCR